jgi:elongation factor P
MLNYNEIKPKTYIDIDGEPFEVISSHVFGKQQRKPVNQTKIRNLITGKVVEKTFHRSEKVEEADIEYGTVKYLYTNRGESWFCEENDPSKRFALSEDVVKDATNYITETSIVETLLFNGDIIGLRLPIKVSLKVVEAPPNIKGNTAQGGTKNVVVETGYSVSTPLFIKIGDTIEIDTRDGQYSARV